MLKHIPIPPFFSLTRKGKVFLLLKDGYQDILVKQGIDDLKQFLEKSSQTSLYHEGRILHPSIALGEGKRMVLRQYFHGGLLRAVTGSLYFFGSRSFQELAITEEIRSCGIPTVEPIGAIHQTVGFPPLYRAYLLTLEVPEALNGIQYLKKIGKKPRTEILYHKRKMIRRFGLQLRQFHQAGFFHQDLQLKNVMVAGDRIFMIDFDRSCRKRILSTRARMKNLLRLNRSAEKWRRSGLPLTRTDRWRFFLAYAGEDEEIRKAMKRVLLTSSFRFLLYRFGWAIEKFIG